VVGIGLRGAAVAEPHNSSLPRARSALMPAVFALVVDAKDEAAIIGRKSRHPGATKILISSHMSIARSIEG
jgi:hypothetical protein